VHVVGKHHPGVDTERRQNANASHRVAEVVNALRQQARSAVGKVNRKKISATGDTQAAVVRHLTPRPIEPLG
jgi:hypothetical protein